MGRTRKSSGRVTLVLIGLAAVGCSREPDMKRDVYASREDCLADWARKPEECTAATDRPRHSGGGYFFYGPMYSALSRGSYSSGWSGGNSTTSGRAVGSTSVSRGGFGSTGHASSSSG
jgi:uncharacterized protein YgiB involved in biofilm formation